MKHYTLWLFKVLFIAVCFSFTQVLAQPQPSTFNAVDRQIVNALNNGTADDITRHFGQLTTISLLGNRNACSKTHCNAMIAEFLAKVSMRSFTVDRAGSSGTGYFTIGTLRSGSNSYRVYYSMRQEGDEVVLQELRVEQ